MNTTMHPDRGALRAALDGERADVAAHVSQCDACQARSAAQAEDAAFAAARFPAPVDISERALQAALSRRRAVAAAPATEQSGKRNYGAGLFRVAAALISVVLVGAVLSTAGGREAAAAFLERFRAERVVAVPVDFTAVDPAVLQSLTGLADIEGLEQAVDPHQVDDLTAAAAIAGFTAAPLDRGALPATASGPVHVLAQAPQTVFITFKDRADVPEDIRGARLRLKLPGAVVQAVGGDGDRPVAVRGEAGALEVVVDAGPPLEVVRSALLSLDGLPEETVAALSAIEDWETTLPLPVPAGRIAWSETTVAGRQALAFGDESGLGSALLWHNGERFVGVAGRLPLSQVRAMAEGGE